MTSNTTFLSVKQVAYLLLLAIVIFIVGYAVGTTTHPQVYVNINNNNFTGLGANSDIQHPLIFNNTLTETTNLGNVIADYPACGKTAAGCYAPDGCYIHDNISDYAYSNVICPGNAT